MNNLKSALILTLMIFGGLIIAPKSAMASNERLTEFTMTRCYDTRCIELRSPEALRSSFDSIYVFSQGELTEYEKTTDDSVPWGKTKHYTGSGYFDPEQNRIVLRNEASNLDLSYNLKTGQVLKFVLKSP